MVPDPTVPVVSWAGRVSPVLRRSLRRLGGASSAGEATGSIRVLAGSGPEAAGTRSTGTGAAGAGGRKRRAEERGVPPPGGHQQDAAEEDRGTRQEFQPQAAGVIGPRLVGRVG